MGLKDGAKAVAKGAVRGSAATVVGYWRGLTYPFKGMKFVFISHPSLVRFWIVPILVTCLLLGLMFWGSWKASAVVTNAVWTDPGSQVELYKSAPGEPGKAKPEPRREKRTAAGDPGGWLTSVGHGAHVALELVVLVLLWALGLIVIVLLTNVIAAPFNDLLSEEVERLATGQGGSPFSLAVLLRDTVRTVGLELFKLVIYAVIMGPLFVLSGFIPVVGHALYSIFGFVFTAMYFAIDYVDWPASRRNRDIVFRFGMLKDHFMPMFGFGTGVWLFLFIPLVNLLFMPAAVAGGTLLFLELEGKRRAATGAAALPEPA